MPNALDTNQRLNPQAVREGVAAGFGLFIRYVTGPGALTADEAKMIHDNGGDVAGVMESTGLSGDLGYQKGYDEAKACAQGIQAAGGPHGGVSLLLGAFDRDGCNGARAQPYIDGARDFAHAQGYTVTHYGPAGLMRVTRNWDGWWQTMSTGFCDNAKTNQCSMSQHLPYLRFGGVEFDPSEIHDLSRCGAWHLIAPAPPKPKPTTTEDNDMKETHRLLPGDYVELDSPVGIHALLAVKVDTGGLTPPGAMVRIAQGGPWSSDTQNHPDNPWAPVFAKAADPGLGPDPFVAALPDGTYYRSTDGRGGMVVVGNLSRAQAASKGIDVNRWSYDATVTVSCTWVQPPA